MSATYTLATRTGRALAARSRKSGRILPITDIDDAMRVAKLAAERAGAVIVVTRTIVEGSDARSAIIARVGSAHRLREVPVPIGPAVGEDLEDLEGVA